jgi:hypothetical protein
MRHSQRSTGCLRRSMSGTAGATAGTGDGVGTLGSKAGNDDRL